MSEAKSTNNQNLIAKISVATVFGKIPTTIKQVEEDGKVVPKIVLDAPVHVMRLIGHATGFEVRTSQYGDSLRFSGVFKAVNPVTGEIYRSGACFLPKVMEEQLGSVLDSVEGGAEFALDIAVVPANNAYGYEYRVKPLTEVKEAPVLARLEEQIGGLLALPSPVKAEETAKPTKAKK